MKLSAKQRALLDALPPRRQAFVLELLRNGGNQTQAAIAVGYAEDSARQQASAIMTDSDVSAAVEALREKARNIKLGSLESRRAYMRKKALHAAEEKDQLKALEMLGRTHGDFVDRKEMSGPQGAPIEVRITFTDKALRDAAAREDDE